MDPIIVWILFLLVNGQGLSASSSSTQEECLEERNEALKSPAVIMTSECVRVILTPTQPKHDIGEKQ